MIHVIPPFCSLGRYSLSKYKMFCSPFFYLIDMICLKSCPLYIYVSDISLFFLLLCHCQCYIQLMVSKFLDSQLWATSHSLLSDDGHVNRLQKQKEDTEIIRVSRKGEIWTAVLEARKAVVQAVKLSDLKMAKMSWWVWAACIQVFSHREPWMHRVGLSQLLWSLKTCVMQQSEQPSKENFASIVLVLSAAYYKFSLAQAQTHKSTLCGLHTQPLDWNTVWFVSRDQYLGENHMSIYELLMCNTCAAVSLY